MSETGREIPTGLNEFHVVRLFKCAVTGALPRMKRFVIVHTPPRHGIAAYLMAAPVARSPFEP